MRNSNRRAPAHLVCKSWHVRLALHYARNLHQAVGRGLPEARGLLCWMSNYAAALGFDEYDDPDEGSSPRRPIRTEVWQQAGRILRAAEARAGSGRNGVAAEWVQALSCSLQLDAAEAAILELRLQYTLDPRIRGLVDIVGEGRGPSHHFRRDPGLIAYLLGATQQDIEARLSPSGRLLTSGLLHIESDGEIHVLNKIWSLIKRGIGAGPLDDQLLGTTLIDTLAWDAFAHLGQEAEIAAQVLQSALEKQETGINILLWGPPGTGKTTFAATLSARVGVKLRSVAETDDEDQEPERHERLAALRFAQRLGQSQRVILLFDEAEDLFIPHGRSEESSWSRVFIHRLLERMQVPVIWTANDISALGPAVLRRMTMCLELKLPDARTRAQLWRRMGEAEGIVLDEAAATRLARLVPAAPAVASTALRATRLAGGDAETVRLIVEGVARAVAGGRLPAPEAEVDTRFDAALVNADCDLEAIAARLTRPGAPPTVSFLLSGPPGSGKSAWVRHLAGRMGLPVLQKRASDLLNCYLGETEHNIARAFAEARDAGAFLVFDEADSLLFDRNDATRSWEISQVNEMLTWMEQHPLPFACTTNLPGRLDTASLRRFLVKARFDWLKPAQARLAFRRFFGLPAPAALDAARTLTPADFALVHRRAALAGVEQDAAALARLLLAECEGRTGGSVVIGFGVAA